MKLSEAVKILEAAGVPNASYDAKELFCRFGGFSRAALLVCDAESSSDELCEAVRRRASREPLQYILGRVFFYNEEYKVNENCLIPRPDTEILVEYACKNIPKGERFFDLCTGSGCVGISVLCNTEKTSAVLADISEGALEIARENAQLAGIGGRADFRLIDVCKDMIEGEAFAVLSNPPYVTDRAYEELEKEIYFEPKLAFVGGEDGLKFYRAITEKYKDRLKPGGFIAYEIGYDQGAALSEIAENLGMKCEIIKDLSGCDRVAVFSVASKNN